MRAVVQRVSQASVTIDGGRCEGIDAGLLVYIGVGHDDTETDAAYLVDKIRHLRVFSDEDGKQNLDVGQAGGQAGKPALSVLVVSAFTRSHSGPKILIVISFESSCHTSPMIA